MKHKVIAIDGYSACGKSTLAKALAKKLKFLYVDSGAMYRAVSLYFLNHNISIESDDAVNLALENIQIDFQVIENEDHCFLNGKDVEKEIRSLAVSNIVSDVAAISSVRRKMVELQRKIGQNSNIIMDGRDIGTVVFPKANLKVFLSAEEKIRVLRRLNEYKTKKIEWTGKQVQENLKNRDLIDSTRKDSPLRKAKDAIEVDNSYLNENEQIELLLGLLKAKKVI